MQGAEEQRVFDLPKGKCRHKKRTHLDSGETSGELEIKMDPYYNFRSEGRKGWEEIFKCQQGV